MAEEKVFFDEGGIRVTSARIVVPAQTYAMSGLTAVKSEYKNPSRIGPIICLIIGAVALIGGGKNGIPGGLIFLAGGIAWWILHKPTYFVVLSSASGEVKAFSHKDSSFISKVVSAVNEAIIHRG